MACRSLSIHCFVASREYWCPRSQTTPSFVEGLQFLADLLDASPDLYHELQPIFQLTSEHQRISVRYSQNSVSIALHVDGSIPTLRICSVCRPACITKSTDRPIDERTSAEAVRDSNYFVSIIALHNRIFLLAARLASICQDHNQSMPPYCTLIEQLLKSNLSMEQREALFFGWFGEFNGWMLQYHLSPRADRKIEPVKMMGN